MSIDAPSFRRTVSRFATGVTVIATESGGSIHAMTANSFTSLSLDPPLVLFCVAKNARMSALVQSTPGFSVNILSRPQQDISAYFAGKWAQAEPPAFSFDGWEGVPRLAGCAATLACVVHAVHEGGDHWIVVGRVTHVDQPAQGPAPLVFFAGRYLGLEEALTSQT